MTARRSPGGGAIARCMTPRQRPSGPSVGSGQSGAHALRMLRLARSIMTAEVIAEVLGEEEIAEAIDQAEEVLDPLDGLIDKTVIDPSASFEPEVLERPAELKKQDRPPLRAGSKKQGGSSGGCGPNQADILIQLAQSADLFHTPDST